MFQATIHTGSDSPLHLSGRAEPYDLEVLREYLLARRSVVGRVEIRLPAAKRDLLLRVLGRVAGRGVELVLAP